jgi:hypothetical protein
MNHKYFQLQIVSIGWHHNFVATETWAYVAAQVSKTAAITTPHANSWNVNDTLKYLKRTSMFF